MAEWKCLLALVFNRSLRTDLFEHIYSKKFSKCEMLCIPRVTFPGVHVFFAVVESSLVRCLILVSEIQFLNDELFNTIEKNSDRVVFLCGKDNLEGRYQCNDSRHRFLNTYDAEVNSSEQVAERSSKCKLFLDNEISSLLELSDNERRRVLSVPPRESNPLHVIFSNRHAILGGVGVCGDNVLKWIDPEFQEQSGLIHLMSLPIRILRRLRCC